MTAEPASGRDPSGRDLSGRDVFRHELVVFDDDDELLDLVVPFAAGGVAHHDVVTVAVRPWRVAPVTAAIGDLPDVEVVALDVDARPATLLRERVDAVVRGPGRDGRRTRLLTEVPHAGEDVDGDAWLRYELGCARALCGRDVWGLCVYDGRLLSPRVHGVLEAAHTGATDGEVSAGLTDALLARMPSRHDPLERRPSPLLVDPTPAEARAAVRAAGEPVLTMPELEDLQLAVSEVVTNALRHGRAPVEVRIVVDDGRGVVVVNERGDGPPDLLTGMVPPESRLEGSGLGLWLAHQLAHVSCRRTEGGYTVRLATAPPAR